MQIITDSSCDLPKELIEKHDIIVVPLNIEIEGKNYVDGVDLSHQDFYVKMAESPTLPKTSQPSPHSFIEAFKEAANRQKEILSVHLSSRLSGTFETAILAKELSGQDAHIFDSLNGSMGLGLQVLKACKLIEEGLDIGGVLERLKEYRDQLKVYVYLETIENAVKGGRVSKTKELIANLLNVKVVVHVEDGYVKILKSLRGKKRAISFMMEKLAEQQESIKDKVIAITHCDCLDDAIALKEEILKRFNPENVIITTMGPVIGTHSGQGGLLVAF
jgi:DegV family protein with EDD domain